MPRVKPYFSFFHFVYLSISLFVLSCRPNLDIPEPSAGDANFSKFVALGGNFLAGYQDGSLYLDGQKYSIPSLLAKQFEFVGGGNFNQPLMPDNSGLGINSKPWESNYVTASRLRYKTDCKEVSALKPVKDLFSIATAGPYLQHVSGSFQNLSVPFATISDYLNTSLGISGTSNPYFARFTGPIGISSMASDAISQQPTFFASWAGMEDIYEYARYGGYNQSILSSSSFALYLDSILSNLNTKGIIANIPDLTSFPFYTLIPWNGLELTKVQADSLNLIAADTVFFEGKNGFLIEEPKTFTGYRLLTDEEYILLTVPIDSIKCFKLGVFDFLPDRYVLDSTEVPVINNAISQYNSVIAAKAQQYNLALVDMNAYFKSVITGIKWDGVDFNAEFVSGGFYSLDGFHPNQKGYALIANEFIKAINAKYNASIPYVNCAECNGIKFP